MPCDQKESDMREHDMPADAGFFSLDGDATKRLKAMAPDVLVALDVALESFYDSWNVNPTWRRCLRRREAPAA
jgi:hypothetical protein